MTVPPVAAAAAFRAPPFRAVRRSEVHEAPVSVAAPIGYSAAIPRRLYGDGRFGRLGRLALQPCNAPRRIKHIEQPLVNGFGPGIGRPRRHALAKVSGGGLDVCLL